MTLRRLGLLTPFQEVPGEVNDVVALADRPAVLWQVLTGDASDSHTVEAMRAMGTDRALLPAIDRMRRWRPDVVVWACTSASFVFGRAGAVKQHATIEAASGVPSTTTSFAFVEALAALAIDEVAVVSPYPEPATAAFASFLEEWGVRVEESIALGCPGASTSERLTAADVGSRIAELRRELPVLLPDTAVWGMEIQRELAPRLSAPLLVANTVTLWQTFQLAGMSTDLADFGDLRGVAAPGVTRPASVERRS